MRQMMLHAELTPSTHMWKELVKGQGSKTNQAIIRDSGSCSQSEDDYPYSAQGASALCCETIQGTSTLISFFFAYFTSYAYNA